MNREITSGDLIEFLSAFKENVEEKFQKTNENIEGRMEKIKLEIN